MLLMKVVGSALFCRVASVGVRGGGQRQDGRKEAQISRGSIGARRGFLRPSPTVLDRGLMSLAHSLLAHGHEGRLNDAPVRGLVVLPQSNRSRARAKGCESPRAEVLLPLEVRAGVVARKETRTRRSGVVGRARGCLQRGTSASATVLSSSYVSGGEEE